MRPMIFDGSRLCAPKKNIKETHLCTRWTISDIQYHNFKIINYEKIDDTFNLLLNIRYVPETRLQNVTKVPAVKITQNNTSL